MPRTLDLSTLDRLLTQTSALAAMPPEAVRDLRRRLYPRRYGAGVTIIREGAIDKDLFLLGSGEARVTMLAADGHEVEVGRLRPGEVFGEWSLLTHRPRATTVTAVTEVETFVLHQQDYEIVLDGYLSLVQYMMRALSVRQREYAGLLAAQLNLWGARHGGMQKNEILTASFLAVAANSAAPLARLSMLARVWLWLTGVQEAARANDAEAIVDCRQAMLRDGQAATTTPGRVLASFLDEAAGYAAFPSWWTSWSGAMDLALAALLRWAQSVEDHEAERQARTALVRVYWAAIHIAFDSHVADIAGLVELDQRASAAVIEAEEINRYIGDLRLREQRPGFKKPEGEARPRKRQLESDLREIEQRAKELRKSSGSASTVARMARLLAEYYLRLPDLKPRLVALPNDL